MQGMKFYCQAAVCSALLTSLSPGLAAQDSTYAKKLAPYVASPQRVVDRMLEMANLKPGETVYDLGCGDGRILITAVQRYKVKAVGVEIAEKLVAEANRNLARAAVGDMARIIHGDLMEVDLSPADVVTIYLMTQANEKLRPKLEKSLKPGARVVSLDYSVPGWKPTRVDKSEESRGHLIYLYDIPANRK
jgi:protein-L-isoaspartate O-methyltransferase